MHTLAFSPEAEYLLSKISQCSHLNEKQHLPRAYIFNTWSMVDIWKAYRTYCLVGGSMSLRGGL